MMRMAKWLGDFRTGSLRRPDASAKAARDAVAHLKPAVVVTGGSRGIGAALGEVFVRAGYEVVLIARNRPELDAAARGISAKSGRNVTALACDVTHKGAAEQIGDMLSARGFYTDILVLNAGVGLSGLFEEHATGEIDHLLALNVSAPARLMLHNLAQMRARRRGGILTVSSLGGVVPGPYQAAYYASKAFALSLAEAVAAEVRGSGVRISVLAPGPVETSFHSAMGAHRSLYRLLLPALSPERTARSALAGFLLGNRVIVPGLFNKLLYVCLRVLPHPLTVAIAGLLLKPPSVEK